MNTGDESSLKITYGIDLDKVTTRAFYLTTQHNLNNTANEIDLTSTPIDLTQADVKLFEGIDTDELKFKVSSTLELVLRRYSYLE